ncbi:MAG: glycerophosphodiester phosphodiesterase [Ilumatobacteraceae bacterium]
MTQVLAHRGASRAERENTVAAFRRARELGADAVELDARLTADGVLVVHHDPRLADTGRPITDMPFRLLPDYVPTLDAALDACEGMWVNIEIKNDENEPDFDPTDHIAELVVHSLARRGEDDRWLISSFRLNTVYRCRLVEPEIPTVWLVTDVGENTVQQVAGFGHQAVHPYYTNVTETFIAECHGAGVKVNVWTCDDADAMARLAAWGVDGICTNVPDVAVSVLRSRQ